MEMPGKGQPHRQKENTGHVADLVLMTKQIWLARLGKGGEGHREQKQNTKTKTKCLNFCDSKVTAISHTVCSGAVAKAGGRQWLRSYMKMRDSFVGCM
jgi:hypothetical protein